MLGAMAVGAGAAMALGTTTPAFAATPMLWPNGTTTRPNITSGFGPRPVTIEGASSYHAGTDFTGYSTVRAVAAGSVVHIGWRSGWSAGGYMVWLQHDGFLSRSLHMVDGSAQVSMGQQVSVGQAIGTMGNTGINGGVHHHLEIAPGGGGQVDPVPFITARINGLEPPVIEPTPTAIGFDYVFLCITPINGINADAGIYRWLIDPAAGTKRNIDGAEYDFLKAVGYREVAGLQPPVTSTRYKLIQVQGTTP